MKTILIVDDDFAVRRCIALMLKGEGYEVLEAENGMQAFTYIDTRPFDLVIVDLFLAGKNGMELVEEIKKSSPHSRFLVVTAYGEHARAAKAREMFKENYLDKIDIEKVLINKVRKILNTDP